MKVILTKDVAKVGRRGEVKELADGYARNFIIARGLGVVADARNLAKLEVVKKQDDTEKKLQQELLQKLLSEVGEKVVVLKAKANEQGHLFASLHSSDISRALREQYRLEIPEAMIELDEPIKTIGEHNIKIKTSSEVGKLKVIVEAISPSS